MATPWNQRYAQRMQWMGSSVIRELLKLTEQPDVISFAGGLPAPELFPVDAFAEATNRVLSTLGSMPRSSWKQLLPSALHLCPE